MLDLHPAVLDAAVRAILLVAIALAWVVLLVRVLGLRSFSKMTAFDFVVTLATGSVLASAATADGWPAFVQALVAAVALLGLQYLIARGRRRFGWWAALVDNSPVLLMRDGAFLEAALRRHRVRRSDVIAKLREANAIDLSCVRAVVLETTGDISVLHGDAVDPVLLEGVEG